MDCGTGNIYSQEEVKRRGDIFAKVSLIPMNIAPTDLQMGRKPSRVGRNEPCPCNSGKKFKHFHLVKK